MLLHLGMGVLALPGPDETPPAIEQAVNVNVNVDVDVSTTGDGVHRGDGDADVVDAELVEDEPRAPPMTQE